ncbi:MULTISPECIES: M28 family peptidase [Microbacterium]|uniref:M28 family peptidase n=1 Tax=Microbacterium TaxID=33882 RepID=UPI002787CCF8|nr:MULTISPECIES: M28 family peptidase [Microbacterium]MDQ1083897.1 Zn-dependent M28 family amino/carboxypeptidase [Microbacterium sp. SORGH_AS_0344]MDQ1170823.1 Zn-dependent M28 family amino/carboxypeptidase [Microbacterium proteolyticum]
MFHSRAPLRTGIAAVGAAALLAGLAVSQAGAATAATPSACGTLSAPSLPKMQACIAALDPVIHMKALQKIADENNGNRAATTSGYDASVAYVAGVLEKAGWDVSYDEFDFFVSPPPVLTQISPTEVDYESVAATGTGYGSVTADVVAVDTVLDPPRDPVTSGCEPEDFAAFPEGAIALVQRGTCTFRQKAVNAEAAGAEGVIIFNQGNTPEREPLFAGTLLGTPDDAPLTVPVVTVSFADGAALAAGTVASLTIEPPVNKPQVNVIAELPGKNADNVVMAGAHLDSVEEGPGINDNGSGSAALLSAAQALGNVTPENTLRFAWWGAEEAGLVGSSEYVDGLAPEELEKIALYLNFDMIASPNFIYTVYDADESSFAAPVEVPEGSEAIESLFASYFTALRLPYDDSEFSGRSDYQAFINNGIPSGGLFTGAEEIKTEQQAALWGGTAGESFDPNYHTPLDTLANYSKKSLYVNTGALATALLTYAYSTESVNGVAGKALPIPLPKPAPPAGTFVSGGGMSLPHTSEEF